MPHDDKNGVSTLQSILISLAANRCYACGWALGSCQPFNCSMRYKDDAQHLAEREGWLERQREMSAALIEATSTPSRALQINAAAQEPSGKSPGTGGNAGYEQKASRGAPVRDVPVAAAPSTTPHNVTLEKWLSYQPHLEDHGTLPITHEWMYTADIVRAAWEAGTTSRSATALFTLDTAERVCFYEQEFYVLSNFSAFRVQFDGVWFDTSEQAYHYQRFDGRVHKRAIVTALSAHEAFRYAQDHKSEQRIDWDAIKVNVMKQILRAKVDQHEYVRRKLLETGDRELVENSWRDPYWGWGPNRDGLNRLGKLWMEVRADLRRADGGKETNG